MFNKLVISTSGKRSNRTARFFFGTSIFYVIAVACAFAISILAVNPKLADTSERIFIAPLPPPAPRSNSRPPQHTEQGRSQQDLRSVRILSDVINHPDTSQVEVRHAGPPKTGDIGLADGPIDRGDGDVLEGLAKSIGVPGGHDREIAPQPKPPDPPKSVTQTRADDNRQPLRLASTVLQGKAIVRRTPDYPPLGKQIRLEGSVSVEVMIAPDGHVESVRAVSGHPLLASAALAAARGWRFEPTLLNGTPVQVTGIIVFNFKLN
jgi:TonB family protein